MRSERISVGLTKEEKARIRIEASDLHISMSALFRMRVFAPVQYVPQTQRLPRLNRPPSATVKQEPFITELKMVLSQGVDLFWKKYDHIPKNGLGDRAMSIIRDKEVKLREEENLADEVGIK